MWFSDKGFAATLSVLDLEWGSGYLLMWMGDNPNVLPFGDFDFSYLQIRFDTTVHRAFLRLIACRV